jgi:arylsulfatase A-like enzyme
MLTQQARSPHDAILSVMSPAAAALRMGDWKLVGQSTAAAATSEGSKKANAAKNAAAKKKAQPAAGSIELYNLATDIGETINLADKEPDRVATMQARLAELLKNAVPSGPVGNDMTE